MKLNLKPKTREQELIKAYLEENADDMLADKINKGTPFQKDGKNFINKKTLDGFMKYASDEARKLAEKGANSACVEDNVVYGWAVHYFEEDGIEGTLFNRRHGIQETAQCHSKGSDGEIYTAETAAETANVYVRYVRKRG